MSLSDNQLRDMRLIAELEVRRYLDHYLNEVFPEQVTKLREHTHLMIERHNSSPDAHGGVEAKVTRAKWIIVGALAVGGGLGAVGKALLSVLVG